MYTTRTSNCFKYVVIFYIYQTVQFPVFTIYLYPLLSLGWGVGRANDPGIADLVETPLRY